MKLAFDAGTHNEQMQFTPASAELRPAGKGHKIECAKAAKRIKRCHRTSRSLFKVGRKEIVHFGNN